MPSLIFLSQPMIVEDQFCKLGSIYIEFSSLGILSDNLIAILNCISSVFTRKPVTIHHNPVRII
jgi:hypothetical protein